MLYVLAALIIIQTLLHYKERSELIDRIDGKKPDTKGKPPKYIQSAHEAVLKKWRTGKGGDE